jgi:hypothetical protein
MAVLLTKVRANEQLGQAIVVCVCWVYGAYRMVAAVVGVQLKSTFGSGRPIRQRAADPSRCQSKLFINLNQYID